MLEDRPASIAPKVLIWDVESSKMLVQTYSLKVKGYLHHQDIVRNWNLLGASWKWWGDSKCPAISVRPEDTTDDYEVVSYLHAVLTEADVLAGHNSDKFDLKKFNTRALFHGFSHIGPKVLIDTLKLSRANLDLPSHALGYINKFLGIRQKAESPDWDKVMAGDVNELRKMRYYNKDDVLSTEELLNILIRYSKVDLNKISPVRDVKGAAVHTCPSCQSPRLRTDKPIFNKKGKLSGHLFQCLDCQRWNQK